MKFPSKIYVDGQLIDGETKIDVFNPANEELVATVTAGGMGDVHRALQSARDAFPKWAATSIAERQDWMRKLRDEVIANEDYIRTCVHHEMGKPWDQTREDWDRLVVSLDFYAEEIARLHDFGMPDRAGTHTHKMVYEPAGVVVAFLAWNFPVLNIAFKLGPAIAAGCPIIIRPSNETPISAYAVAELCHKIGIPKGVIQILGTESLEAADALSASEIPAVLTLIGSTETGKHVVRTGATSIKKYALELGGNAPVLVFNDANLNAAVDVVAGIKFSNAGQICVSPNRVFVHNSVLKDFTDKVVAKAEAKKTGWGREGGFDHGPVINGEAYARIKGLIDDAVAKGATINGGGDRPAHLKRGHYLAPTVLGDVTENMGVYQTETFAPIVSIIPFEDETDLLEKANDCGLGGLTAYIFTEDLAKAERYAASLRYGEVHINGVKYDIDLPHLGMGYAGVGCDCSVLALHDYLVMKRVSRALDTSAFTGLNA